MEAADSPRILVNSYETASHYIPEDSTAHSHHYENLKSPIVRKLGGVYLFCFTNSAENPHIICFA
jgi:hypothetical protein